MSRLLIIIALNALMVPLHAFAEKCTKMCNPQVSKPCGQGCIPLSNTCRKPWATTCSGLSSAQTKKGYDNPKHVDEVPK